MPMSPPTLCPRCGGRYRGSYCPECSNWNRLRVEREQGIIGGVVSPWERIKGRPDLKKRWLGLRKQVILLHGGRCSECGEVDSRDVDHLDGTDYMDDSGAGNSWLAMGMVRLLCAGCHRKRTAKQGAETRWGRGGGR